MDKFARGSEKPKFFGSLQRCATLVTVALLGSLLGGCVSGAQYAAQKDREVAAAHTVVLKQPLFVQSGTEVFKLTTVKTSSPVTAGPDAELWVVQIGNNQPDVPLGPLAGVDYKFSEKKDSGLVFPDGRRIPVAFNNLQVRLCSHGARVKCDWLESLEGQRLSDGKGPLPQVAPLRIVNEFQALILDNSFKDEAQVPAAMIKVQRFAAAAQAVNERSEVAKKRADETHEANRVAAFKRASVGTSEFCESAMLIAPGHPVSSGTLFACERGKVSLGELRAFGWEVTSMSRRPYKDMIGREGDSVSIAVKKTRKVG